MTEVVYLAHPVSGDAIGNAARARLWLRWLMDSEPDVAFCAPWLPYLDVCDDDDPAQRERCLRDDLSIAVRCDGIVLVGGRISSGMKLERDAVLNAGGWSADLTSLGLSPPTDPAITRPLRFIRLGPPHVFLIDLLRGDGLCFRCGLEASSPVHAV